MKMKTQILLFLLSILFITCTLFTLLDYSTQKDTLMAAVDDKLILGAKMIEGILGEEYHDKISDSVSVSKEEYIQVVELFNQLCLELEFQYLWSNLKREEHFHFTTSTSRSKDIAMNDHAPFFSKHSDPASFAPALKTMQPTFSEFHNEWGHGKMLLFPKRDALGRTYLLGTSVSTEYVYSNLNLKLMKTILLGIGIMFLATFLGLFLSNTLAIPIVTIAGITEKIAKAPLNVDIKVKGSLEIESLSDNVRQMNNSLRQQFKGMHFLNSIAIKTTENLSIENIANNALVSINDFFNSSCSTIYMLESNNKQSSLNLQSSVCCYHSDQCVHLTELHKSVAQETINVNRLFIKQFDNLVKCLKTGEQLNLFVGIPLTSGTYKIGVLVLGFIHNPILNEETKRLLSTVCQHIGMTLHNALLFKEISEELEQKKITEVKLKKAKEEAEDANRAKSEFIANISHEIRTPLNAVIGFSEILSNTDINKQQKSYVNSIKTGGNNLLRLINDILDLSKLEAKMMELNLEPVNIKNIFNEIEQIFHNDFISKGVTFSTEIQSDLPEGFLLDENRLRQIFLNLVGNAMKFTEKGFVKLRAEYTITEPSSDIGTLVFTVEDTGIGIPKESQMYIFDSFRQQAGHDSRKYGGTGLGLAICQRLVDVMNGEITIKSEPGVGSSFFVKLKDVKSVLVKNVIHKNDAIENIKIQFDPNTVLIVDDIESNRDMLKALLLNNGLKVVEAKNGIECLSSARKTIPKMILTDIRMPEMDGITATKILKNDDLTKDIPIVAISASTNKGSFKENIDEIFEDILFKPVQMDEYFKIFKKYLPFTEHPSQIHDPKNSSILIELQKCIEDNDNQEMLLTNLNNIYELLEQITGAIKLDNILIISEYIINTAKEFKIDVLNQIGNDLKVNATNFDLPNIKSIIIDLKSFLRNLNID